MADHGLAAAAGFAMLAQKRRRIDFKAAFGVRRDVFGANGGADVPRMTQQQAAGFKRRSAARMGLQRFKRHRGNRATCNLTIHPDIG
jgi:hypothetical protein